MDEKTRREVSKRLEVSSSTDALKILLDWSQLPGRRTMASIAIGPRIPKRTLPRMFRQLGSNDEREAWDAAIALTKLEDEDITLRSLQVLKEGPHQHNRLAALHVIQRLRDRRSTQTLIDTAIDSRNTEHVRAKAFDVLGSFAGSDKVRRALLFGLVDASPNIRLYSLVSLCGQLKHSDVRMAVAKLTTDKEIAWEGQQICKVARA
ncbi:MAG: hypothetical protein KIT09_00140 [Bryobacteraceae bacterium]|nr:hypothetical protein [Bryobacteraceae bacterium]